jgi:hypothetical protein
MALQTNPQLELAVDYVRNTNKHLFLTGKAGSGKTTFLHQLKHERLKRLAVVAPTGVAAINAGGMTIHSLFQLPIGLHLPGVERKDAGHWPKMKAEKIQLIRSLDLLVIDEISMVRADLLDAVDQVLQQFRGSRQPFGGVQLLMIGDLHQLPPVVKDEDWELLRKYYDTPYFFGSHALRQTDYISIELKHIYRQADPEFIDLLNQVRDNCLDGAALLKLNSRFIPNFQPAAEQPYITLTATNAAANEINRQNLERLAGKKQTFPAQVVGEFPPSSFPTEQVLEFKIGAQVMFIKNDVSPAKSYFNGKLGRISDIGEEGIWVRCDDSQEILVAQAEWQNMKYTLNEETKEIEEQVLGAFFQYPLRLAWAITIHKSQGLTFERCIIDAQAAFASGQVYVALSRCKSFEGIVLRSQIQLRSVKTDPVIKQFSEEAEQNLPNETKLRQAKRDYQSASLRALFRFDSISNSISKLLSLCIEHANTVLPETLSQCRALEARTTTELVQVSEKFAPQLAQYLAEDVLPEANEALQGRVKKAAEYFVEKLSVLSKEAIQLSAVTDNQEVASQFGKVIESLLLALGVKQASFAACQNGFSTEKVNRAQVNAELDFYQRDSAPSPRSMVVPKGIPNPELYRQLLHWREATAKRNGVLPFEVVPNCSLREMVVYLPTTKAGFLDLPGIGKRRFQRYGQELLAIIHDYRQENKIEEVPSRSSANSNSSGSARPSGALSETSTGNSSKIRGLSKPKSGPSQTKQISFAMFRAGKTISEIAAERKLVASTIAGHLAHFVGTGELDIFELLAPQKVEELQQYFFAHPESTSAEAKFHFGDKYDYAELKMVIGHLSYQKSNIQKG